jgi:hypothetical protein
MHHCILLVMLSSLSTDTTPIVIPNPIRNPVQFSRACAPVWIAADAALDAGSSPA